MTEQQEITNQPESPLPVRKRGLTIVLVALVVLLIGFGAGYFQLFMVNKQLAEMVVKVQEDNTANQHDIAAMRKNMSEMQLSEQKIQAVSQQQEQQMAEWRAAANGDFNKWHLAEAQYLVKLANDNLQFSNNTATALVLLQRADAELTNVPDSQVSGLRQALQHDISTLRAAPQIDVDSIYKQLSDLDKQIDSLPLPATPLQSEAAEEAHVYPDESWWRAALYRIGDALRKIVVIKNVGDNNTPVVTPDEKAFLYQNLHAQLENAIWALLHRDNDVFQDSVTRMLSWCKRYFVQDEAATKDFIQQMESIAKTNVTPQVENLEDTLKLFNTVITPATSATLATETAAPAATTTPAAQ